MFNVSIQERLEEFESNKILDFQLNFNINKKEKERLDEVAKRNKTTTSKLLRFLIHEFLNQLNGV